MVTAAVSNVAIRTGRVVIGQACGSMSPQTESMSPTDRVEQAWLYL